jgi:tetratricopeptide (TPR) repeat protein
MKKFITSIAIAALIAGSAAAGVMPGRKNENQGMTADTVKAVKAGDAAMNEKDFQTAVEEYSKAINSKELEGDNLGAILLNRGIAYVSLKQCPNAIEDFTGSVAASTTPQPSAYAGRGQCYLETGKTAEGVSDFKQAVTLAPTDASYAGAFCTASFNAKIYVESGPACEAYSAFVPTNAQIIEASAVSYQNAGNKPKALAMWNKLLALDPASAVAKQGIKENT